MINFFTLLPMCLLIAAPSMAQSSKATFPASKDNTIYQENDNSNGIGDYLFVGKTNQDKARRALLAFQLNIPMLPDSSVQIDSVVLTLNSSKTLSGPQTFSLHRLTKDWGESSSDANANEGKGTGASTNDAAWNYTFYNKTQWTTPGGDYEPSPSATFFVDGINEFKIKSEGLANDLRYWLANPAQNFGWILIGNESSSSTAYRFVSKNNTSETRPYLDVHYALTITNLEEANTVSNTIQIVFDESSSTLRVLGQAEINEMQVIDKEGRILFTSKKQECSVQTLAAGLYIARITTPQKVVQKKVWIH